MKTLRGFASESTSSWRLCAPTMFLPLARPFTKASTFSTVLLKTATVKPFDSMFITRFSPMTARPISPMSALFISLFLIEVREWGVKWLGVVEF